MTLSSNCKVGETVKSQAPKIIRKLKHNRFARGSWFVITTAIESTEVLYVLSKKELQNGLYDLEQLRVLGIGGSRKESFSLVTAMIQEAYDAECILELKKYFIEY